MAVSDNYEIMEYKGDSNTNTFGFPFRCRELTDLVVELIDSDGAKKVLVDGTDYRIETSFNNSGGVVTYPAALGAAALSSDQTLRIYRDSVVNQTAKEFRYPHEFEAAFDKDILLIQEAKAMSKLASTDNDQAMKKIEELTKKIENMEQGTASMAIRPQTIVKGATGDIPSGWSTGWCNKPAEHITASADSELTIKSGLQVAAGVEGKTILSNELASDTTLDVSSATAQTTGKYYTYADINMDGSMSFGYKCVEPQVGIDRSLSNFLPVMTSNVEPTNYIASASSEYSTTYAA